VPNNHAVVKKWYTWKRWRWQEKMELKGDKWSVTGSDKAVSQLSENIVKPKTDTVECNMHV